MPTKDAALLTAIFDAAVDAIIVSDASGLITRANAAAFRLFGYTEQELLGRNITMLMPEGFERQHDGSMSKHIQTVEKQIIGTGRDVEGLHKNGISFPLHLSVGRAQIGEEILYIGILHDLSSRRATEQVLSRSQRLDAIGQMTGGIAHDFNNLLTVVIGNLELLERKVTDDRAQSLLQDALEAAELGADLTSRLMVFARNSMLSPEACNLNEVCEKSLSILRRTLGSKYTIRTRFQKDIAQVMIDPTQLQTSIMNLVLNARDAMPNGGKLLFETENVEIDDTYIAQETDVATGSYVRLTISDNGDGMTPETQKRAFEPFYSTKGVGKGSGLGLSMVYGFVRQSHGHITLYSELGHGTTFGIYFPAVATTVAAIAPGQESAGNTGFDGRGRKILIVEDNPKVRKLSVARLIELGFVTLEAKTADEALTCLANTPEIAVLFSDIVMPGSMSGYELAHRVRTAFPKVKILLTSGYSENIVRDRLEDRESFAMIRKPFRSTDLATQLQALLTGSK